MASLSRRAPAADPRISATGPNSIGRTKNPTIPAAIAAKPQGARWPAWSSGRRHSGFRRRLSRFVLDGDSVKTAATANTPDIRGTIGKPAPRAHFTLDLRGFRAAEIFLGRCGPLVQPFTAIAALYGKILNLLCAVGASFHVNILPAGLRNGIHGSGHRSITRGGPGVPTSR